MLSAPPIYPRCSVCGADLQSLPCQSAACRKYADDAERWENALVFGLFAIICLPVLFVFTLVLIKWFK